MFLSRRQSGALSLAVLLGALVAVPRPAAAQSDWSDADIGNPALMGTSWSLEGFRGLIGAGAGVSGNFDQLHFLFLPVSGDVDISACVEAAYGIDPALSAGLMIRESLDPDSRTTSVLFSPDKGGVALQARGTPGAPVAVGDYSAAMTPLCLRLVRRANVFTAYRSDDRSVWTAIGQTNVEMPVPTYVGLALSSHDSYTKAQAMFSAVALSTSAPADPTPLPNPTPLPDPPPLPDPRPLPNPTPLPDPTPLPAPTPAPAPIPVPAGEIPAPWKSGDIGNPSAAGSEGFESDAFTLSGAGDIAGTSDQFRYVYQSSAGDTDLIARVLSFSSGDPEAKAGIMLRSSLEASATHAFVGMTAGNQVVFARRPFSTGGTSETRLTTTSGPGWVRLRRVGYLLTAYWSPDGTTWTTVGSETIPMAPAVWVGLAVSSRNSQALATAVFSDVNVPRNLSSGSNQLPLVQLISPTSSDVIEPMGMVTIAAEASDSDGSVARVDFYAGFRLLRTTTAAPFQIVWYGVPAGVHSLWAVAVDSAGGESVSVPVVISVGISGSSPPIGPKPDAIPPVPKVPVGLSFTPSPDHDSGVTSYVIDVHRDGDPITATPVATGNLGKPAVSNGQIELNIDSTMDQVPGGTYYIVLKAVGPGGVSPDALSSLFSK